MTSKQKFFQGPDAYHRMNFLYQASQLTASSNEVLSSYYAGLLKSIGRKVVLRIDPEMKRQLCKRCNIFLQVDSTCQIREDMTEAKQKRLSLTCQKCGFTKTYLMNTKQKLWLTDPRSDVAPTKDLVCTKMGKKIMKKQPNT